VFYNHSLDSSWNFIYIGYKRINPDSGTAYGFV